MISSAWRKGVIGVALVALLVALALSSLACSAGGTTTTVGGTATTGATVSTTAVAPPTTTAPAPASIAYSATIQEGRAAAKEVMEQTGAPSLSLALVEGERVVWVEQFGLADKDASTPPTAQTMYDMASVSKTPAAIAIMKLVDQGKIDLDAPLTSYLPDFRMASPEYTRVTVRMLLDHSSGFPGTDDRNSVTSSPFLEYAGQVLASLQDQRLKHSPGSQNEYCNDGFTVIEKVVASASGMSYVQFVQDEILTPLGMTHSRYPLESFPRDSFAQTYTGDRRDPQQFVNTYASGGLYSTPSDMVRLAMMFIGRGALGETRILSESAVAAMSVDQTLGTFDPVQSDAVRFGLGWDTVAEPGLKAVGVSAWAKGGDTGTFGSAMVVAPDARLGVVVCGTNGINSTKATVVAERILLQALVDQGTIAAVPAPLPATPKPSRAPTPAEVAAITGVYAMPNLLLRVDAAPDDSLTISSWSGEAWPPLIEKLTMRADGFFSNDQYPFKEFSAVSAAGVTYLVRRDLAGAGHYQEDSLMAQKMAPVAPLSAAWQGRLSKSWLLVNERPDALVSAGTGLRFILAAAPGLAGLITATPPAGGRYLVDPSQSSVRAKMTMLAPQAGRDVNDVVIESRAGEEWVRFGSFLYRPIETVPSLAAGSTTVTIGPEGLAEWRSIAGGKTARTVSITTGGAWKLFDPAFLLIASGDRSGTAQLPAAAGCYYLTVYGVPASRHHLGSAVAGMLTGRVMRCRLPHRLRALLTAGATVILMLGFLAALPPAARALTFADVPADHPNKLQIEVMAQLGIAQGFPDGLWRPDDPVTRQQFAKMVVAAMRIPVSEADACLFGDVEVSGPESLYPDNYVAAAGREGITTGTRAAVGGAKAQFSPDAHISLAQVVTMVARAAGTPLASPPAFYISVWGPFNSVHGPAARLAQYNGLLRELPLADMSPWRDATRAEAAALLFNLMGTDPSGLNGRFLGTSGDLVTYFRSKVPSGEKFLVPVEQLAELYITYGRRFGIRADMAWAQMVHETGFGRYGGDVKPEQNNFAGIGATGGIPGNSFATAELGVIAQYAHLAWYVYPQHLDDPYCRMSTDPTVPGDPRHFAEGGSVHRGNVRTVLDLSQKWAYPGIEYGAALLDICGDIPRSYLW